MSTDDSTPGVRAARRAQREAERASRAQRKADAARQRAMDAAREGGLFQGMSATPHTAEGPGPDTQGEVSGTLGDSSTATAARASSATSSADPADAGTTQAADVGTGPTAPTDPARDLDPARRRKLIAVLAAASVILVVVAGLATWGYVEAREDAATEQAIADAPRAATDAAREITTQMFTYDHRTVDSELAAVREHLTDPALGEFVEKSMPAVAEAAKTQEASVYATVAAAAPQEVVDPDNVTVLVMLNRMVSTKEAPEAASSASRLSLDMVQVDGTWKLGKLNAL